MPPQALPCGILLILLSFAVIASAQTNCSLSDLPENAISFCPEGSYFNTTRYNDLLLATNETNCTDLLLDSGTNETNWLCSPCDGSCFDCFGPLESQCYNCTGLYVLVNETQIPGTNEFVRNTSRDVLMCVTDCPSGSVQAIDSKECVCPQGFTMQESGCQCSGVLFQGECVSQCPSGYVDNQEGNCTSVGEEVGESSDNSDDSAIPLAGIIGIAVGGVVIALLLLLLCLILCCCYCYRRGKRKSQDFQQMDGERGTLASNPSTLHTSTVATEMPDGDLSHNFDLTISPDRSNPLFMHSFNTTVSVTEKPHSSGEMSVQKSRESFFTVSAVPVPSVPVPSATMAASATPVTSVITSYQPQIQRSQSYIEMTSAGSVKNLVVHSTGQDLPHSRSLGDLLESGVYSEPERKSALVLPTTPTITKRPTAYSDPVDRTKVVTDPHTPPSSPKEEYVDPKVFEEDFRLGIQTYINKDTIAEHHSLGRRDNAPEVLYEESPFDTPSSSQQPSDSNPQDSHHGGTTELGSPKQDDFQTVDEFLGVSESDADSYYNLRDARGSIKKEENYENVREKGVYLPDDYVRVSDFQKEHLLPNGGASSRPEASSRQDKRSSADNQYIDMKPQPGRVIKQVFDSAQAKFRAISEPSKDLHKYENLDYPDESPLYENTDSAKARSVSVPATAIRSKEGDKGWSNSVPKRERLAVLHFPTAAERESRGEKVHVERTEEGAAAEGGLYVNVRREEGGGAGKARLYQNIRH